MKKKIELKILDCTLRDGGYYNNWEFPQSVINDYLSVMRKSNIKFVEIGFRSSQNKNFKGPTWHTTESFINNLNVPSGIKLGVMINSSEFTNSLDLKSEISKLFKKKKDSKLYFVRIASHYHELDQSIKICEILKSFGYFVGLNLMQISEYTDSNFNIAFKKIKDLKIDVLYFADSLGSLTIEKTKKITEKFVKNYRGEIGIHAHDNLSLALSNALTAKKNGANWLDSTITGMGRGPGNVKTEELLTELFDQDISALLMLINNYFEDLKLKFKWGTNIYYFLSAKYSIHPTYIQELIKILNDPKEIIKTINELKSIGAQKFDANLIRSEFQRPMKLIHGNWMPKKIFDKKDTFLIAPGKISDEYKNEIENYIIKFKPIVISLSPTISINKKYVNFYVACNPMTMFSNIKLFKKLSAPLIIPKSLLSKKYQKKIKGLKYYDFGIGISENNFIFKDKGASLPRLYNFAYALAIATSGNSKRIFLAGFDGSIYSSNRIKQIDKVLFNYSSSNGSIPLCSVTPTPYGLMSKSIFSLSYE